MAEVIDFFGDMQLDRSLENGEFDEPESVLVLFRIMYRVRSTVKR